MGKVDSSCGIGRSCVAAMLCLFLLGCATEVLRYPVTMTPVQSALDTDGQTVRQDTLVKFNTGYDRVIRKGTRWKPVGNVAQGRVFAPAGSIFSVEGAHVHEAYLVVTEGNLVGFYLPVERSFVPLGSVGVVNLWEEQ